MGLDERVAGCEAFLDRRLSLIRDAPIGMELRHHKRMFVRFITLLIRRGGMKDMVLEYVNRYRAVMGQKPYGSSTYSDRGYIILFDDP